MQAHTALNTRYSAPPEEGRLGGQHTQVSSGTLAAPAITIPVTAQALKLPPVRAGHRDTATHTGGGCTMPRDLTDLQINPAQKKCW